MISPPYFALKVEKESPVMKTATSSGRGFYLERGVFVFPFSSFFWNTEKSCCLFRKTRFFSEKKPGFSGQTKRFRAKKEFFFLVAEKPGFFFFRKKKSQRHLTRTVVSLF